MSENFLRLIPQQSTYVPKDRAQATAEQLLRSLVAKTSEVYSEVFNEIVFIDAGANSESISCPMCEALLSDEWWSNAMRESQETQFRDLEVLVPCCNNKTTLNDLNYNFAQGFARYVLTARSPHIAELNEQSIRELERILACTLRPIWAHY